MPLPVSAAFHPGYPLDLSQETLKMDIYRVGPRKYFFLTSANDFNVKSELEITGSGKLSRIHAFTSSLDTDS